MANKLNFIIGLCSNSFEKTSRFLSSLSDAVQRSKFRFKNLNKIIVVRPLQYKERENQLSPDLLNYLQRGDISFLQFDPKVSNKIWGNEEILECLFGIYSSSQYHIAAQRNRTILSMGSLVNKTPENLYAVLDDDLIFENAILNKKKTSGISFVDFTETFDYFKYLPKIKEYCSSLGPIIGGNTGCPPIPPTSAFSSIIDDRKRFLPGDSLKSENIVEAQSKDYYYDLSVTEDKSEEKGFWLPYRYKDYEAMPTLSNMLLGVLTSRPLIFDEEKFLNFPKKSFLRGGNTFFGSWDQLSRAPHLSLFVNGMSTRRSDMISAKIFPYLGNQDYYQTYFPLGHFRMNGKATNSSIIKKFFYSSLLRETFGVLFLRVFGSFLDNGDWKETWSTEFTNRLESIKTMFSLAQEEALSSLKESFNYDEISLLKDLSNWSVVEKILRENDKLFYNQCQLIINNFSEIITSWKREIEKYG
jgi:hypothetical protein